MPISKDKLPSESLSDIEAIPASDVYPQLSTSPRGLSSKDAQIRLQRYGRNSIREEKRRPLVLRFLANFTHLMATLLWVAGLVAFAVNSPQLAIAVWMVNIINGAFSFWQEYKAEKATEAMKKLLPMHSKVVRDGKIESVPAEELVPGDILLLTEGDRISADARVVEESELRVDQSTLTGESQQVRKTSEALLRTSLARVELPNLVFAGTSVLAGNGKAVVFATGMKTEFGKIAHFTQSVGDEPSPLQKEMARLTKVVTVIAVGIGMVFFVLAILLAGVDLAEGFIFGMGMIVAFVPEGLLPTVTLSLAVGVQRMAKRNALIKRLSAVETLGSTSVICTDKTGTLTQNEMTVRDIWLGGCRMTVSGGGYWPEGTILDVGLPDSSRVSRREDLRRLLVAAGLCNNARLLPPDEESPRWRILGDPTEGALRVAALKGGVDVEAEEQRMPRLFELPFDSRRKRMSTIHSAEESQTAFVKGAPREVLALCTRLLMNGREESMDDSRRDEIMGANDDYARKGLRVLAVASRSLPKTSKLTVRKRSEYLPADIEKGLTFLGLIAMMDPPRPEVLEAVQKCHRAGIRIVMITGDYGLTAESIARRIGIVGDGPVKVVTGAEVDAMDDETLQRELQDEVIFARVAPEHKLRVVAALQELGCVVAVTGDGVNDAPALKKADIGVAMGIAGTDVAKETADMILTDDNFASIVNAVEEGRAVYANIKKFTTLIFTSNAAEAVPFILFAFSRSRIPLALTVMQILSIDLGADILPSLALGVEPPEEGVMDRPPRDLKEHLIDRPLLTRAFLFLGPIQSLVAMSAFYLHYWVNGYAWQWFDLPSEGALYHSATAMTLAAVVATQVGNIFAQRTERTSIFRVNIFSNPLIWVGVATALGCVLVVIYVPFLQAVFGTAGFSAMNWLLLLAMTPLLPLADEVRKALVRRKDRQKSRR